MKALRIFGMLVGGVVLLLALAVGALYALFDGNKLKAELAQAVHAKTGRSLTIAGDVGLSVWPNVAVRLGKTTLSERDSQAEFLSLDGARVAVAVMPLLSKQIAVKEVELDGFKATLIKRKDGTLNIADLIGEKAGEKAGNKVADKPAAPAAPLQLDIAGVRIGHAQLHWRDETTGKSAALTDLDLATGRIEIDSARQRYALDALKLAVKGQSGADSFALGLDLPRLEQIDKRLSIPRLALDLDAKSGANTVKAHLESPLAFDPAARTVALDKLSGKLDLASPQMPMKSLSLPLAGSLRADLAKANAALTLATRFDESNIALKLDVPAFAPLALVFALDLDKLDVDRYLPPKKAEDKPAGDGKIDLAALKTLNLKGDVRIGALKVSNIKLAKLAVHLAAAGGKLDVAPLSAQLYEGTLAGSLSVNANGNLFTVKQTLAGVRINPLLVDVAGKDMLDGKGNVVLDVNTRGETVTALKKALAGSASLSLKDGAIKGINLAQSLRDIKSKFGAKDESQSSRSGEKTDFSELAASFRIAAGVAHNDDLAMKSPFLRLAGSGDIDIGNSQLNYLAKASLVASTAGQGGKGAGDLAGITVPVRLSGPFASPSWKIEFGSLVSDAAKAKVEQKGQEVKQKAQEQVKDKLKGLFGK